MADVETLRLTRVIDAPPAAVFRAWTDAEQMQRWFCPHAHWRVTAEADPRVGGSYRIVMHDADTGKDNVVVGTYRELKASERLAFTWRWENMAGFPDTLVTIELRERDGKTELTLIHTLLPTTEQRDKHEHGWKGCLDRLAQLFS